MSGTEKTALAVLTLTVLTTVLLSSIQTSAPGLARRLAALEDRPACTCSHAQHAPPADPVIGLAPPMPDDRVVWERWVRADGRASK